MRVSLHNISDLVCLLYNGINNENTMQRCYIFHLLSLENNLSLSVSVLHLLTEESCHRACFGIEFSFSA